MKKQQFKQALAELAEEKAPTVDLWPEIERQLTPSVPPWRRGLQVAGGLAGVVLVLVAVLLFASWMSSFSSTANQTIATAAAPPSLQLLGSTVEPASPAPGETLAINLRWQTPPFPLFNAQLSLLLLDQQGALAAQSDTPLPEISSPASQIVSTVRRLNLPDTLAPGPYTLQAVVYDQVSGRRLTFLADDPPVEGNVSTVARLSIGTTDAPREEGPWAGEPLYRVDSGSSPAARALFRSCGLGEAEIEAAVRRFRASGAPRSVIEAGQTETGTVSWRKLIDVAPVAEDVYRVTCHHLEGDASSPPSIETLLANVRLMETDLSSNLFSPGETVRLETTWQNSLGTDVGAGLFLYLLDQQGNLIVSQRMGLRFYMEGELGGVAQVGGTGTLKLPISLSPGPYELVVGLYDESTGWRLSFSTRTEAILSGSLSLGTIWVEEVTPPLPPGAACPATETVYAQPPDDPNADPFGLGEWYINDTGTIWAGVGKWHTGGEKVGWIRPAGSDLQVSGRRLDGDAPPLVASIPCCYPTGFQVTGLDFPTPGCWEVTGRAGTEALRFVTEVLAGGDAGSRGITLTPGPVSESGIVTELLMHAEVDLGAWYGDPEAALPALPAVTLYNPRIRGETDSEYRPQRVRADAPDQWQHPYPAEITLALESLPPGTYTLATGIALSDWPANEGLTLDLRGREIGEAWLLGERVTIGRLSVPLEEAILLTHRQGDTEELQLQLATSGAAAEGITLACLHLYAGWPALGLPFGSAACDPELEGGSIGRITTTVTVDTTEGDDVLAVPPTVELTLAGDLWIDGPWRLSWQIPGD